MTSPNFLPGSKHSCICKEGDIFIEYEDGENVEGLLGECKPCSEISPDGTDCDELGTDITNLKLKKVSKRSELCVGAVAA